MSWQLDPSADLGTEESHERFAHALFHEVAQPLTSVACALELLSRSGDETSRFARQALGEWQKVRDLVAAAGLVCARPDRHKDERTCLEDCINEVAEDLRSVAKDKDADIASFVHSRTLLAISGRQARQAVFYLLDHLLGSARKGDRLCIAPGHRGSIVLQVEPAERSSRAVDHDCGVLGAVPLMVAGKILNHAGVCLQVDTAARRITIRAISRRRTKSRERLRTQPWANNSRSGTAPGTGKQLPI